MMSKEDHRICGGGTQRSGRGATLKNLSVIVSEMSNIQYLVINFAKGISLDEI
jgi:hypothetical protein